MEKPEKRGLSANDLTQDVVLGLLFMILGLCLGWFTGWVFQVEDDYILRIIGALAGLAYSRHLLKTISNLRIGS